MIEKAKNKNAKKSNIIKIKRRIAAASNNGEAV